jgi:hypothetical protein
MILVTSVLVNGCGDSQDAAPALSHASIRIISAPEETESVRPSEQQLSPGAAALPEGNRSQTPMGGMTPAPPGEAGPAPLPELKFVTLSWDPSDSADLVGHRISLIAASTGTQQIIDVGEKTELTIPLAVGEIYAFTVTAYNTSAESQPAPYILFQLY